MKSKEMLTVIDKIADRYHLETVKCNLDKIMEDQTVSVAVLGEYAAGKSTLINALMGKEILPAMDTPTTAAVVEIFPQGEMAAWVVDVESEAMTTILLEELPEYIMGTKTKEGQKVVLQVPPNERLPQGIRIVDTPGVASIETVHDSITFGYLPFVDVVLLVIDINKGTITSSLLTFLQEKVLIEQGMQKIAIVLSHATTMNKTKQAQVVERITEQLRPILPLATITVVDSRTALEGDYVSSGFDSLHEIFQDVSAQKDLLLEKRKAARCAEVAKALRLALIKMRDGLALGEPELDKKIEQAKAELSALEKAESKINAAFSSFRQNVDNKNRELAKAFAPKIAQSALEGQDLELEINVTDLTEKATEHMRNEYKKLSQDLYINLPEGIEDDIKARVEAALALTRDAVNVVGQIATVAIAAAATSVIGPAAAGKGAAVVAKQLSLAITKKSMFNLLGPKFNMQKLLVGLGQTVADFKGLDGVLQYPVRKMKTQDIVKVLNEGLSEAIGNIVDSLQSDLNERLYNEVLEPRRINQEALMQAREEREKHADKIMQLKKELQDDVQMLGNMLNKGN